MSEIPTTLRFVTPGQRYAWRFDPTLIRGLIPAGTPGVYMLYDGNRASYIGRSDRCLRRRLLGHGHRARASHVCWQTVRSADEGYRLESIWFHDLPGSARWNALHPAKPHGSIVECPACWADSIHRSL